MVTEMFADERTEKIKALLLDYKRIDINTLISMIPASPATVRRDLEKMEKEGFLRRTHGGVVHVEQEEPASPVPVDRYLLEKEQIGAIAVAMIEPNDTVFLGNGTTCLQVAKNLRDRPNIRVVSNNIGVIAELLSGKLDGAFIETVVAEAYAKNYPELCVKFDVPYEQEGAVVGVSKDNGALLAAVNLAIAAAKEDGSMDKFVAEANTLAEGNTYEGLLDNQG